MICCPYRYSTDSVLPFLSTWLARDELEDEGFDAACLLQSEGFCVQPANEELVEVACDCREQQEHRVLSFAAVLKS